MIIESIELAFQTHFNRVPIIVRSPARINIIGEHTACSDGYVMPVAIDIAIYVAVSRRNDEEIHLYAESYGEAFQAKLSDLKQTEKDWVNYILGVADQLQKWGYHIGGFNLYIDGDVPLGTRLSSSAAIACATGYALMELFSLSASKLDLVKIAQMTEQGFAGVENGFIDQFAAVFGKRGNAILLDCKSMFYDYIPLKLNGYQLVLLNTNIKYSLSNSASTLVRAQCEQGLAWVKANISQVTSLSEVNIKMLDKYVKHKDIDVYRKCKFIIEENQRIISAAEQLKNGNLKGLGQAMFQAHDGLREFYQVSCKKLDFLVDSVKSLPYVLGARMMGEGFDGCTLSIVKEEKIDEFIEKITQAYEDEFSKKLDSYVVETDDGVTLIL
ncbi:galactokinase [Pedobacter polaris]|uniref:Galactokinase n=1 Tax=Pedobacter polaris TaxID=2571273 RepID=A0A4U1CTQ4_9SPHI|nr:galactokinase [Pedobacter polaris]TKC10480.1 galactokinase [Pedobacter polaris]